MFWDEPLSAVDVNLLQQMLSGGGRVAEGINVGLQPTVGAGPTIAPLPGPESVKIPQTAMDKLAKGLIDFGPLMAQVGASLMGGKETPMGQAGLAASQMLQTMQLNEAMKKLLQQSLSGKSGFQGSQIPELSSAEVSGLTPEMLMKIYGTALSEREKAVKRPLEELAVYGDLYNKVMTGQYHAAQVPLLLAQAQEHLEKAKAMPATNEIEWAKKLIEINKAMTEVSKLSAEIDKIKQETEGKKEEIKLTRENIKKISAETGLTTAKIDELTRDHYMIDLGDKIVAARKRDLSVSAIFPKAAPPEGITKAAKEEEVLVKAAKKATAPLLVKTIEDEIAKTPEGKQKVQLMDLLNMLRSPYGGEVDPSTVEAMLTKVKPDLLSKYSKAVDVYVKGMKAGFTQEQIMRLMAYEIGVPISGVVAATPTEKSGTAAGKSALEKALSPTIQKRAEDHLAGKPPGSTMEFRFGTGYYRAVKNADGSVTITPIAKPTKTPAKTGSSTPEMPQAPTGEPRA